MKGYGVFSRLFVPFVQQYSTVCKPDFMMARLPGRPKFVARHSKKKKEKKSIKAFGNLHINRGFIKNVNDIIVLNNIVQYNFHIKFLSFLISELNFPSIIMTMTSWK